MPSPAKSLPDYDGIRRLDAFIAQFNLPELGTKNPQQQLQAVLVEQGCLEERVLTDRDSFPIGADGCERLGISA